MAGKDDIKADVDETRFDLQLLLGELEAEGHYHTQGTVKQAEISSLFKGAKARKKKKEQADG